MTGADGVRDLATRTADTRAMLEREVDCWVATADLATGLPWLVPLSYVWDGRALLLATPGDSLTGRNLSATGRVRLGVGPTSDVVMIDGVVDVIELDDLPVAEADGFAARTGFDPRRETPGYRYFRVRPRRVQAWRTAPELRGRDVMRDGTWLLDRRK